MSDSFIGEPFWTLDKSVQSSDSFLDGTETSGPTVSIVKPSHEFVLRRTVLCHAIGKPSAARVARIATAMMTAESALSIHMKSST